MGFWFLKVKTSSPTTTQNQLKSKAFRLLVHFCERSCLHQYSNDASTLLSPPQPPPPTPTPLIHTLTRDCVIPPSFQLSLSFSLSAILSLWIGLKINQRLMSKEKEWDVSEGPLLREWEQNQCVKMEVNYSRCWRTAKGHAFQMQEW